MNRKKDSKDKRDIENLLREKLEVEPSRDFDKRFWKKFDREFSTERPSWIERFVEGLTAPRLASVGVGLMLVLGSILYSQWPVFQSFRDRSAVAEFQAELGSELEVLEHEFLDDVEFYVELEEANLTDEEWDLLLADGAEAMDKVIDEV